MQVIMVYRLAKLAVGSECHSFLGLRVSVFSHDGQKGTSSLSGYIVAQSTDHEVSAQVPQNSETCVNAVNINCRIPCAPLT